MPIMCADKHGGWRPFHLTPALVKLQIEFDCRPGDQIEVWIIQTMTTFVCSECYRGAQIAPSTSEP